MLCFLALAGPVAYRYVCDFSGRPRTDRQGQLKIANLKWRIGQFTIRNLPFAIYYIRNLP
ncbi:MAG: hypothetical protein GDA43_03270 [Hormoscilla sp. SP5CHS1]|nr:hypothetical protein [Hormoscilla sp. SP12CHS1]MBC6452329.1 hypothetical protein [Hormoscilla sp. SP5CHS1]MBC6475690.1 hypothetical protein [Hormoscilla sp. GM102CHS1]